MTKTEEGLLEMKQTDLIERIIKALGLDDKNATPKYTPAESKPLTRDEAGELPKVLSVMRVWLACFYIWLDIRGLI